MTAEKPEGDVALLCHWLRRHRSEGVPIPFAAERAIIVLESQATRIATLTEAINAFIAKYDELEPVILGMTVRCYGPNGYKGKTWGVELAALRALSAGQGEAK